MLNKDNATYFYLEGIKFKAEKMSKACENLIALHFADLSQSEQGAQFIMDLPADYF